MYHKLFLILLVFSSLINGYGENSLNYYAVTKTQLIMDIDSAIERLKF